MTYKAINDLASHCLVTLSLNFTPHSFVFSSLVFLKMPDTLLCGVNTPIWSEHSAWNELPQSIHIAYKPILSVQPSYSATLLNIFKLQHHHFPSTLQLPFLLYLTLCSVCCHLKTPYFTYLLQCLSPVLGCIDISSTRTGH